jgi:cytochrome P450
MNDIPPTDALESGEIIHLVDLTDNVDRDYYDFLDRLREQTPVAMVETGGVVAKAILRCQDIRTVITDSERFSAGQVADEGGGFYDDALIPSSIDPPAHTQYRQLLGPMFSPIVARDLGPRMRDLAKELISKVAEKGECDVVEEIAKPYAGMIFFELVGLPLADMPAVLEAEKDVWLPNAEDPDMSRRESGLQALKVYLSGKIAELRSKPDGSFLAKLMEADIEGRPLTDPEIQSIGLLACLGGVHTTKSTLGKMMFYLGSNPDMQQLLRDDPKKIPAFIEEYLRIGMLGHSYRHAKVDTEIGGCPIHKGELLSIQWTSGNRDPREFEKPTEFILDRKPNKHVAMGFGPHMCLGMHIARLDMAIMLEEWLSTLPQFHVSKDQKLVEQPLGNIGFRNLRLCWR